MTADHSQPGSVLKLASGAAHFRLGQIYWRQGKLADATAQLCLAAAVEPNSSKIHFALGKLFHEQRRYEDAIAAYRRALEIAPTLSMAYQQLGLILQFVGKTDEALAMWRQWLAVEPDHPVPRHMVAAATGRTRLSRAADDYIRALFDEFADSFDEQLKLLGYRAPDLIAEAVAQGLGPPAGQLEVLDAGCGTGLCGPLLRPYAQRLTGVDLSAGMLDQARERGDYDLLVRAELTGFIKRSVETFDLITSADTFVYFGDLKPVFKASAAALHPGGLFVFTLESMDDENARSGFALQVHGRYCHKEKYVRSCLRAAGFRISSVSRELERTEMGNPVIGLVVVALKSGRLAVAGSSCTTRARAS